MVQSETDTRKNVAVMEVKFLLELVFCALNKSSPQITTAATHSNVRMPTLDASCQSGNFRVLEPVVTKGVRQRSHFGKLIDRWPFHFDFVPD
jgi:hypothetical protein